MKRWVELSWKKSYADLADTKLVKLAAAGDSDAYGELIQRYKEYLYKMAFCYVKDEQKALDLLGECTYKGLMKITSLKNPAFFKTWMTTIIVNLAMDCLKKNSNVIYLEESEITSLSKPKLPLEMKMDLYDAIDQLKPDYKSIIILRYFHDLGIEEISQIMKMPSNTIKSYLYRAKQQLRQLLKEESGHESL